MTIQFYNHVTNNQPSDFPYLSLTTNIANKIAVNHGAKERGHQSCTELANSLKYLRTGVIKTHCQNIQSLRELGTTHTEVLLNRLVSWAQLSDIDLTLAGFDKHLSPAKASKDQGGSTSSQNEYHISNSKYPIYFPVFK